MKIIYKTCSGLYWPVQNYSPNVQHAKVDSNCLTADLLGSIIDAIHSINPKTIRRPIKIRPIGKYKRNWIAFSPLNLKVKYTEDIEIVKTVTKSCKSVTFPRNKHSCYLSSLLS